MTGSIFERCGGFVAVRKIISSFYDKVLDSPRLGRHFVGVDMRALVDHQTKFITYVMGGPATFSDAQIQRAHTQRGISRAEFREMIELLAATLEEAELEPADIEHIRHEVARREHLVVADG